MFRLAVVVLVLVAVVADDILDKEWGMFKALYNKQYDTDEEERTRRSVWQENLNYINEHNLAADNGDHSYRLGINQFADRTKEELFGLTSSLLVASRPDTSTSSRSVTNVKSLPDEVDWTKKGWVTAVKNQGDCGACWAFSATGALEAQNANATGNLVSLSEQNLIDCSREEGNLGCAGGDMDFAFEYIKKNGGIDTEQSYPYTAKEGDCQFDKQTVGATLASYVDVPPNESSLQEAVATIGPTCVGINAHLRTFQFYKSGVYDDSSCSHMVDHGVLVVGYGVSDNKEYWLVKNSWGESWGEDGYVKMRRNSNNQCGIASYASYPLVK